MTTEQTVRVSDGPTSTIPFSREVAIGEYATTLTINRHTDGTITLSISKFRGAYVAFGIHFPSHRAAEAVGKALVDAVATAIETPAEAR